ncbi:sigma-54-dependent Fis family transcriptional regulator [Acidiphilium sp. PA]|uniref:sigma-54-dependent Fis family transcriptional regulator n=1 Tax=Acidiphilium sp. PA TaxID=2871705 RepID=UPI002243D0C4|nr:sigma-54-dependent Fis family transcriptional regulator [Acidiphilium sp. PA]MCW8307928.1 sigma-54-dependent Fis family transcriptional regulator [Acidiphilium sp. PA]
MRAHASHPAAAADLATARRNLATSGAVVGLPPLLTRSWTRCVSAGLSPERPCIDARHLGGRELHEAVERQGDLTMRARPIIDYLHAQIRDSGCIILLSDQNGFLLDAVGDPGFSDRAARVALQPGACWAEADRGTNAVGTALIEAAPVVIHGPEHFLDRNGFLACAAAPLAASDGSLLGVLDISCDHRIYHPHTFGLVRAAAQMIENRMFEINHVRDIKLRFHTALQAVGTVVEGVLAISPDGLILGANRPATDLLGLRRVDMGRASIADQIEGRFADLLARDRQRGGEPIEICRRDGSRLYVRLEIPRINRPRPATPMWPADALAALDTGDAAISRAIGQIRRVLGKPIPILLRGETGAGKDVMAQAIHAAGPRRGEAFVAVNCAALPEHLIEAELFGYAPGAFTGARREGALGRIREAAGGTLFLDEIGDMPASLQSRLLRVLEDRTVAPLGGRPVAVDFALISATNRDLRADIAKGRFRSDLYYRLNGLCIALPLLRERTDLVALITSILARAPGRTGPRRIADPLLAALQAHTWPGNIRELASVLRIAASLCDDGDTELDWHHLPDDIAADLRRQTTIPAVPHGRPDDRQSLRTAADQVILQAVEQAAGNMSAAARRLGISRNTLYRRLAALQPAD